MAFFASELMFESPVSSELSTKLSGSRGASHLNTWPRQEKCVASDLTCLALGCSMSQTQQRQIAHDFKCYDAGSSQFKGENPMGGLT